MNLISCENCAVVIDSNKVAWPDDFETEEGINEDKAMWDGDKFQAFVKCPNCSEPIIRGYHD